MATIRQVSEKAEVSVATVSRVINGSKWVSDTTKEKVLVAMDELGYQPNTFAQSLATNRSNVIGLVVSDLAGPFFGEMMHSVETKVRSQGKHLVITSGHGNLEDEREAIQFLLKRRCDALILHLDAMNDEEIIGLVEAQRTPIIIVNRFIPEIPRRCVYLDNELGGYLAAKKLISLGHRQMACVTGPLFKADARARLMGFRRALDDAGLVFEESRVVESDFREGGGAAAIERLCKRNVRFTALVCCNDLMAIGAINALKGMGKRVPDDVSVVGYDDVVMSAYLEPGLTTVRVPVADMGQEAAQLALNLSDQKNFPINQAFQPVLMERDSVAGLGVD